MKLLRVLLFPLTLLYSLIIWFRNKLYDIGVFKSQQFDVKTIVVGNLAIGGAGKSPLTMKLLAYFNEKYQVATLSRGYGRKTKGYREVSLSDSVDLVGDEPLQFKKNYPEITIAVDENRAEGIDLLQKQHDLIILDDAFQHRKIRAKCSILLFEYYSILNPIYLLPTGNFRDTFNQTKRADVILISKSPHYIPEQQQAVIERKIRKYSEAPIFYSKIDYLQPVSLINGNKKAITDLKAIPVLLVTGIANPKPLLEFLKQQMISYEHLSFPDHHDFKPSDYTNILEGYQGLRGSGKVLLTTEKDAQRLRPEQLPDVQIYYIPITTFIEKESQFYQLVEKIVNEP